MRYAAYALALELKRPDVDTMTENMTTLQFMEWQAFFRIREEERQRDQAGSGKHSKAPSSPSPRNGPDAGLQARLLGAFSGYQKRQEKLKGK